MKPSYLKKLIPIMLLFWICSTDISGQGFRNGILLKNNSKEVPGELRFDKKSGQFLFRFSKYYEPTVVNIDSIKSIKYNRGLEFVRKEVRIDKSPDSGSKLSEDSEYSSEVLPVFLATLVEGKASLYSYEGRKVKRYFYQIDDGPIEPLIYKKYRTPEGKVLENKTYIEQIFEKLLCNNLSSNNLKTVYYTDKDLVDVIRSFNSCNESGTDVHVKIKENGFQFRARLGTMISSTSFTNLITTGGDAEFLNVSGPRMGLEIEYVFPKRNWSMVGELTFSKFSSETSSSLQEIKLESKVIALPLSVRRYVGLGQYLRLYGNAGLQFDLGGNAELAFELWDDLELKKGVYPILGIGTNFKNTWSLEARYAFKNDVIENSETWDSSYNSISINLAYKFF
ncbi:MAG: porin family protein [bacterium]|nr:porin family protein [bacterium]